MFRRRAGRRAGTDGASVPAAQHLAWCQLDTPPGKTHRLGTWLWTWQGARGQLPGRGDVKLALLERRAENPRGPHGGRIEVSFPHPRWRGVLRGLCGGALETARSNHRAGVLSTLNRKENGGWIASGRGLSYPGLASRPRGCLPDPSPGRGDPENHWEVGTG